MGERQRLPVQTMRILTAAEAIALAAVDTDVATVTLCPDRVSAMSDEWARLAPKIDHLMDLFSATSLLGWDQLVMMPGRGAPRRARTLATMQALIHERLRDPELGSLLEELQGEDSLNVDQRASIRILRREHKKATLVPEELVRELAEETGLAYQAWTEARPADDFSMLEPRLTKVFALEKQKADALGWDAERYDALLDIYEPDMRAAEVESLFTKLVDGLKPIVEAVLPAVGDKPEFLSYSYEIDKQQAFSEWIVAHIGFDYERGRLDVSPHPFTGTIGPGDVRQTTKYVENNLMMSVYASLHETGHALYEQGIPEEMMNLPVGDTPSLGMHESQSRMWENQVGRSRAFCDFMLPHLKERFPDKLGTLSPDEFHRAVNYPQRSLIRITADELTYNLHLALRFELELAIFRDELEVSDLPDAWDAAMEKHVGIRPENRADGVLQDMHWSTGTIGYFPTYTLGTLYAAAIFDKAQEELGDLSEEFRRGETQRLLDWLRKHIHSEGYRYPAKELAQKVLGEPLSVRPFLDYVKTKYSELYDVSL
jgi:carboxypeptidase Taq